MFLHEDETFFKKFFVVLTHFFLVVNLGGVTEAAIHKITPATDISKLNDFITESADNGDEIRFEKGTYYFPSYSNISVNKSLTFSGGWDSDFNTQTPGTTVLNGTNVGNIFHFWKPNDATGEYTVKLDGFTITRTGGTPILTYEFDNVVISNCNITDNSGCISVTDTQQLIIKDCVLSNNTANDYNGIIDLRDVNTATITGSTLSDNGGNSSIYVARCNNLTLSDCTVTNNTGGLGSIYLYESNATITESAITDNKRTGIYVNQNCVATIENCKIANNWFIPES